VITMLAFAPSTDAVPGVVERFYWRGGGRSVDDRAQRVAVSGTVRQPYYTPQGEIAGAVLEDGTVILVPSGTTDPLRDLLRRGARLAAQGPGTARETGRALMADMIGETPDALHPVVPQAVPHRAPQAPGAVVQPR
jgi:hypothetical protein